MSPIPMTYDADAPRLRINGFVLMGGVEVYVRLPGETARDARHRQRDEERRRHQVGGRPGVARVARRAQRGVEARERPAPLGAADAAGREHVAGARRHLPRRLAARPARRPRGGSSRSGSWRPTSARRPPRSAPHRTDSGRRARQPRPLPASSRRNSWLHPNGVASTFTALCYPNIEARRRPIGPLLMVKRKQA